MVISAAEPSTRCSAYMGGTFDPVHYGHLRSASELKQRLDLAAMTLVPCHRPPHRSQPGASSAERLDMVRLACVTFPELTVDDRELRRETLSFTVDTLADLRAEHGADVPLAWVVGADAFRGLDSWHDWQRLAELAHLIVIARPEQSLPAVGAVAEWAAARQLRRAADLHHTAAGGVWFDTLTPYSISASEIRESLRRRATVADALPPPVLDYIDRHHLYQTNT